MATSSPVALFNSDPNLQAQAALLQQRQALAQKLMEQGMTPIDTKDRTVGGVGYRISPFEGLAKAMQAYMGQKGVQDTTQQQAGLAGQAYAALLNKYQPGADPSYSDSQRQGAEEAGMDAGMGPPDPQKMASALLSQQPAQGGPNPNNPNGIPAELIAGYTAGMVPKEVFEAQAARYKPTDATVQALQGGMDPTQANRATFNKSVTDPKIYGLRQAGFSDAQIHQIMAAEAQKANTMEGRPGQSLYTFNGSGPPQLTAVSPDPNSNMQFNVNGGQVSAQPVPGAVPNKANMAGSTAGATASATTNNTLHMVTMPDGSVVPARGSEIPPLAGQAPGGPLPPGMDADRAAIYRHEMEAAQQRLATARTPEERARAQQDVSALTRETQRLGLQLGQSTAAKAAATAGQEELSKAWTAQQGAHQNAQTNIALLQNMKGLTDKAITGYEPDRRTYLSKLGAYVGIGAMDDKASASDLLNKYSSQLIAGLAQKGGMSTDAARDLVMAGTPNSHMQPGAIKEAIDGLVAREQITQARTAALQKHANARDPASFQAAATAFDQAADPRLFQLRNMAPAQAQSYVNQLKTTNPALYQQLMQKAASLKQMGAF